VATYDGESYPTTSIDPLHSLLPDVTKEELRGKTVPVFNYLLQLPGWSQNKNIFSHRMLHCKTGIAVFLSLARMSLTKLSLAGNNLPSTSPRKVWSKQIQESLKLFFYSVCVFG